MLAISQPGQTGSGPHTPNTFARMCVLLSTCPMMMIIMTCSSIRARCIWHKSCVARCVNCVDSKAIAVLIVVTIITRPLRPALLSNYTSTAMEATTAGNHSRQPQHAFIATPESSLLACLCVQACFSITSNHCRCIKPCRSSTLLVKQSGMFPCNLYLQFVTEDIVDSSRK